MANTVLECLSSEEVHPKLIELLDNFVTADTTPVDVAEVVSGTVELKLITNDKDVAEVISGTAEIATVVADLLSLLPSDIVAYNVISFFHSLAGLINKAEPGIVLAIKLAEDIGAQIEAIASQIETVVESDEPTIKAYIDKMKSDFNDWSSTTVKVGNDLVVSFATFLNEYVKPILVKKVGEEKADKIVSWHP